jgi:hypothetical protein
MTLTPHTIAVLVIVVALLVAAICSRIPVVGAVVLPVLALGVAAGVAAMSLAHGLV